MDCLNGEIGGYHFLIPAAKYIVCANTGKMHKDEKTLKAITYSLGQWGITPPRSSQVSLRSYFRDNSIIFYSEPLFE